MPRMTADTVNKPGAEWLAQQERIKLPRDLMGGTGAMQAASTTYLPKKVNEGQDEYKARLTASTLLNKFKETVEYTAGQVFQKPVRYEDPPKGENPSYDAAYFDEFKEDVNTRGTNLSMFTQEVFKAGVIDGIVFILADHSNVKIRKNGQDAPEYLGNDGKWYIKTAESDKTNGWRPYLVIIKANQILDAYLANDNGNIYLGAFRYKEIFEEYAGDGTRVVVERIRVYFPNTWEVWESIKGGKFKPVDEGENPLGFIPVSWFMPGEQTDKTPGLTCLPALDDLAWMNKAHWRASSDHEYLMNYARSPVWFGNKLHTTDENGKPVALSMGPGRFINSDQDGADLTSIGVNAGSTDASFRDLEMIENRMAAYGLKLTTSRNTTSAMTAMQATIEASAADSTVKGWVQKLQDCMENALKNISVWKKGTDGPALFINDDFRIPYDASILAQISSQVSTGQTPLQTLFNMEKKMGIVAEDVTIEEYIALIESDYKRAQLMTTNINMPSLNGYSVTDGSESTQITAAPGLAQSNAS